MSLDQFINLLAMLTLMQMMVTIGLDVTPNQLLASARDWRTVLRALLANYVLVPAAAVGLLMGFKASPLVAVGFMIAAVCPGAPYGPPFTALAKGDQVKAVGLMVILAGSSALVAPILLLLLLPLVAGNEPVSVNAGKMVGTLALTQFLPLIAALRLRQKRPLWALAIQPVFKKLCTALNVLLLILILITQMELLSEIRFRGYLGMLLLLTSSIIAGWCVGGPGGKNRKTMSIATAVRNAGVTLAIATSSFPGTAAVTAATAYGLFQTIAVAMIAVAWGRRTTSALTHESPK